MLFRNAGLVMRCFAVLVVALLMGTASGAAADNPAASNVAEKQLTTKPGEWKPLFDGKTLKNWKSTDFGGEGEVEVKDGRILLERGNPLTGVTWTGPKLPRSNYEVSLEAQRVDGSDFFCGLTFPVKNDPCSLILGGWGGGVVGLSSLNGFDASENETTSYREFRSGRWYKVRLRVTDDRVQAWIDDEEIVNVTLADKKISIRIEVEASKPFGICSFATTAALRDLKIRELSEAERKAAAEQTP